MYMNNYSIASAEKKTLPLMLSFLQEREDFSLFLLGNFETYGIYLTQDPFSGNFNIVYDRNQIAGVFCLTRSGNLLIETDLGKEIFPLIAKACKQENIPIRGLLGKWSLCKDLWDFFVKEKLIGKTLFASKETLFRVDLLKQKEKQSSLTRFLSPSDYPMWELLRFAYLKESGLPQDLSKEDMQNLFLEKAKKKILWGLFVNNELVSIAELNAMSFGVGQLGGVFTAINHRKKGYSSSLIQHLFHDLKQLHNLRKLLIFTGEDNIAAQKLYRSLEAEEIGFFSLFFADPLKK